MMAQPENVKSYGVGKGNINKKFNGKVMGRHCDVIAIRGRPVSNCMVFLIGIKI